MAMRKSLYIMQNKFKLNICVPVFKKYSKFASLHDYGFRGILKLPVTNGGEDNRDDVEVRCGVGMVRITPALVPTHNKSRHASIDVTRKQAALCWRIMSSQPVDTFFKFLF